MMTPHEQLRLLSVFHYVLAGLSGLFALVPLIYVALGAWMVSGQFPAGDHGEPPPPVVGWFLIALGVFFMLFALAYVVLMIVAGRSLGAQRRWTLCMVAAGLSCMWVPFGTVLGVFTIVVLVKPEVQALFGRAPPVPVAPTMPPPGA